MRDKCWLDSGHIQWCWCWLIFICKGWDWRCGQVSGWRAPGRPAGTRAWKLRADPVRGAADHEKRSLWRSKGHRNMFWNSRIFAATRKQQVSYLRGPAHSFVPSQIIISAAGPRTWPLCDGCEAGAAWYRVLWVMRARPGYLQHVVNTFQSTDVWLWYLEINVCKDAVQKYY